MPIFDSGELILTKLNMTNIELEESLSRLLNGEILLIKGYESSRGKDVLVRLDRRKYDVTEVSFHTNPIGDHPPIWQMHPVEINTFSLHDVFPYDEDVYRLNPKYGPGAVVKYSESPFLVATINEVYYGEDNLVYYTLHGLDGYYLETELVDYV